MRAQPTIQPSPSQTGKLVWAQVETMRNVFTWRWESQPWPTACGPLSLAKQTPCWAFANMIHENLHLQCSIMLLLFLWVHETLEYVIGNRNVHIMIFFDNLIFMIIWQSIWSKLASWTYSGITLDIKVFSLPIDTLKIKHTKKLKEIPSRQFLENLPEKASM